MPSKKIPVEELTYVEVDAKEWRDKVNGNSYWSSRVYFGTEKSEYTFALPFQYGYGKTAEYDSINALGTSYVTFSPKDSGYWEKRLRDLLGDSYKYNKETALKRDVQAWGKG